MKTNKTNKTNKIKKPINEIYIVEYSHFNSDDTNCIGDDNEKIATYFNIKWTYDTKNADIYKSILEKLNNKEINYKNIVGLYFDYSDAYNGLAVAVFNYFNYDYDLIYIDDFIFEDDIEELRSFPLYNYWSIYQLEEVYNYFSSAHPDKMIIHKIKLNE